MKGLPYFKWYPADAETDANFRAMDDADIGFYIRCLNHAWINGGIPADPKERARVLRTRLDTANRRWERVGKCFVTSSSLPEPHTHSGEFLYNIRQETERGFASRKSQRAVESANHRYERRPNAALRARVQSESESESESETTSSVVVVPPVNPFSPIGIGGGKNEPEFGLNGDGHQKRPKKFWFDEQHRIWYEAYWCHKAKADSRRAFEKAINRLVDRDHVCYNAARISLSDHIVTDRAKFERTPDWAWRINLHPATWLNQERWTDEPGPAVAAKDPVSKTMALAKKIRDREEAKIVNAG